MTRSQVIELMSKAGFNTDWTSYANARETFVKYEKLANLIEKEVKTSQHRPTMDAARH